MYKTWPDSMRYRSVRDGEKGLNLCSVVEIRIQIIC